MKRIIARSRRGAKTKIVIHKSGRPRLVVFRSAQHIYSQIVEPSEKGDQVIVAASTLDKLTREKLMEKTKMSKMSKKDKAKMVGQLIGERAKEKNVTVVAFDRAGYRYHGRVKALAEGAREAGLIF